MEGPVTLKECLYHYTKIDTFFGQSGSGLFIKEGEEYFIVGVHVSALDDTNQAVKIDTERFSRIKAWADIETDSKLFDFSNHQIGDEGVKHLSAMNLSLFKKFDLSCNKIGAEGIKHLSEINLTQLKELTLQTNQIKVEGMKYLSGMDFPELQRLHLFYYPFAIQLRIHFYKTIIQKYK